MSATATSARRGAPTLARLAQLVSPAMGLSGGRPPSPAELEDPSWVDMAARHGVLGALPALGGWAGQAASARSSALAHYVRTLHDLTLLRDGFARAGVPWLLVKGAVVGHELYPSPTLRPFADADVLVSPTRLADVLDIVVSVGGTCSVENWTLMSQLGLAELPCRMPAGTQLDLHWNLVNRARLRRAVRFSTAELMPDARPTDLLPGLRTLSDSTSLAHLSWHCAYNGAARLLWLCDVELAAARLGPGMIDEVRDVAERTGTALSMAVAVDRAAQVFPGGSAAGLARALPDSAWREALRLAGRRSMGRPAARRSGRAPVRATRTSTLSSLRALVLRAPDRSGQQSLSVPSGGATARQDYLRWVMEHGS